MGALVGFTIGLFVGALLGVALCTLAISSGRHKREGE